MADWTWALAGCATRAFGGRELSRARGRTVTWRRDANPTAQFTIDGRSDEAAEIVSLATDLVTYREGRCLYRGRFGTEGDQVDPNTHIASFATTGYRGMLAHRYVGVDGAAYNGTAGGAIAWDLITGTQAKPGGDWGITAGVGTATGTTRINTLTPGKPLDEAISEMGRLDNGYEWDIEPDADADLVANFWHPTRGTATDVILDYAGLVTNTNRGFDPDDFANVDMATGADGTTPVEEESADVATDPRGRWERAFSYPTITEQTTLAARALWLLGQTTTLRPKLTVTLRPDEWDGPDHIWIGDTVAYQLQSGRLNERVPARVDELTASLDEDGNETIVIALIPA